IDERSVKTSDFGDELKPTEVHIKEESQAKDLLADLERQQFIVASVTTKEKKRNPVPPFITSKLQQEASRKLRLPVRRTMQLAQKLYEGIEIGDEGLVGLITYMRTDSTRVADSALAEVRDLITDQFGANIFLRSLSPIAQKRERRMRTKRFARLLRYARLIRFLRF